MTCYINAVGALCALGNTLEDIREHLFAGVSPGLRATSAYSPQRELVLGQVDAELPSVAHLPLPLRSRNNAMLLAALAQIRPTLDALMREVAPERVAIVMGSSTSGIAHGEDAMRMWVEQGDLPADFHYRQQELGSPAALLAHELGVSGPAYCISTACTSGAKAIAAGARLLQHGVADVVIVGGADTLARFTVAGFGSIESIAPGVCLPSSVNRRGINLGEAAALLVLSKTPATVRVAGWGESSDAHHISAPAPDGRGARAAITQALQRAGMTAADIGYANLHGTATPQNDAMEHAVVAALLPGVPASSTKALTGHCLGTAGSLEAVFGWLTLTDAAQRLPPHRWDGMADPALAPLPLVAAAQSAPVRAVISNSFAFGGNNIALVLAT
ncbi:beta-ketoacyl-[acyl-carrier-protein] synthase family protein [Silvimonas sp. JCM 19000]